MAQLRRVAVRDPWPFVLATGLFVGATHFVGIAAGAPLVFLLVDTSLAVLFLGAGAAAWHRRPTSRTGPVLVLSSALWSVGSYGPTQIVPIWPIGFAFEGYYDVALGFLALTFPADRLGSAGRVATAVLGGAFVARSLSRLLLQDPPRTYPEGFADFAPNPFAILENRVAFEAIEVAASVVIGAAALAIAVLSARRLLRSRSLARAVIGPVLVASVVAMLMAAFEAFDTASSTATGSSLVTVPEPLGPLVDWLIPGARALVPIAFLAGTLRLRSSSGPLSALASRLEHGAAPAEIDAALEAYIENPQLSELLIRQLAELRASRARLVATADAERRRIERTLHDGAQQHLTSVAIRLEEARGMVEDDAELARRLDATASELRDAIHELRELARGIHPSILTQAGLEPAVSTLARRSMVPVHLDLRLDGRMPPATEVTAYYVIAEALTNVARSAGASRAEVTVVREADGLSIRVRDDGVGGASPRDGSGIVGLEDRVRALNGRFRLRSPVGQGTTLEVWLPCE